MFETNLENVQAQAAKVFGYGVGSLLVVVSLFLFVGLNSGLLEKQIVTPIKNFISDTRDMLEGPEYEEYPSTTIRIRNNVNINSNIDTDSNEEPVQQPQRTVIVYPTAQPLPTSDFDYDEWRDDFDKSFEELRKSNAEKQKAVEDSQAQFCEDNPTLCDHDLFCQEHPTLCD